MCILCFSYDDEIDYVVNSNTSLLLAGFSILFVYVAVVLGNVNIVEQRVRHDGPEKIRKPKFGQHLILGGISACEILK